MGEVDKLLMAHLTLHFQYHLWNNCFQLLLAYGTSDRTARLVKVFKERWIRRAQQCHRTLQRWIKTAYQCHRTLQRWIRTVKQCHRTLRSGGSEQQNSGIELYAALDQNSKVVPQDSTQRWIRRAKYRYQSLGSDQNSNVAVQDPKQRWISSHGEGRRSGAIYFPDS